MTSGSPRPLSILIAALGGQGGGVLTDWIVAAADHAGLPAQATSIPGVAQRTGATTYYVEVYPVPTASGAPRNLSCRVVQPCPRAPSARHCRASPHGAFTHANSPLTSGGTSPAL